MVTLVAMDCSVNDGGAVVVSAALVTVKPSDDSCWHAESAASAAKPSNDFNANAELKRLLRRIEPIKCLPG
jgi:hypothetical protein